MSARISQRLLPGVSRLFGDYLYGCEQVSALYPAGAPYNLDQLQSNAAGVGQSFPPRVRNALVSVLERQNPGRRGLADPNSVAIVTGQQVGLFGGPLLAALKAMTAVRLCERLRARGVKAVPVFWMATPDHDLAEVDHAWALNPDGQAQCYRADLEAVPDAPAGRARLRPEAETLLASFPGADDVLRGAYRPGTTLGAAFGELMRTWFAPWGLLTFDPDDASELQPFWQPVYRRAVDHQPELACVLADRARLLEAHGYHVQVEQTTAASMLFLERNGQRRGLRRIEGGWRCGEDPITELEILTAIAEHPETMSAAALLRPLTQDTVFPTLAQVTGPAETAYLAQSQVLYQALGVRQPVAWPRASATLLDAKTRRLLEKYELAPQDCWREAVEPLLARSVLPPGIERQTAAVRHNFESGYAALADQLRVLDPTLGDAASGAVQKIRHQLEQLEARVARSFARRNGEVAAHARYLTGRLYPENQLPERLLAGASFAAVAADWLRQLHDALDPATPDHQFLELETAVSVPAP